ncbi:MAG TPA: dihydroneopterin aldolase [Candidatus Cloacimonadota bacterium]|jgi:dihydroneopterin aldolase|nr:dihydroneopterin aldolase [Candidatus Cloacimonadales bacterium]HPY96467.1 dihydroneopterin aldolase [Candidatus Cloacimonadota bacterium]HQB40246.1 dihydroneopterin aldolase [Candidatus Cloacimonadota bacterium]
MVIHLKDMIFFGYHGVYPEERKLGQRFVVNIALETNNDNDIHIEHIDDTIDYTKVYNEIKHIMEKEQFVLLENCANRILNSLLERFSLIQQITVKIEKPGVPINGSLSSVAIEMNRHRDNS